MILSSLNVSKMSESSQALKNKGSTQDPHKVILDLLNISCWLAKDHFLVIV